MVFKIKKKWLQKTYPGKLILISVNVPYRVIAQHQWPT